MRKLSDSKPLLEQLEVHSVFSIYPAGDFWRIQEECDGYFERKATDAQLLRLAVEIINLVAAKNSEGGGI